jgi:hypothetical protein
MEGASDAETALAGVSALARNLPAPMIVARLRETTVSPHEAPAWSSKYPNRQWLFSRSGICGLGRVSCDSVSGRRSYPALHLFWEAAIERRAYAGN